MGFMETVKYVRQLSVIDEFGGRGETGKINKFYINLRVTDESGIDLMLEKKEIEEAVLNKYLTISDYIGDAEYSLGVIGSNLDKNHFIVSKIDYRFSCNIITVEVREFTGSACISVKIRDNNRVIASTCYLSGSPSCFFLSR